MEELQGEISKSTITVGGSAFPLSVTEKWIKNQQDPGRLNTTAPPESRKHALFKCTWNTYPDRSYTVSYYNLNIFKSIETTKSISPDHNGIHQQINNRKISGTPPNS